MEALLEKEADVESWNDERMDELSRRVDAGFEKTATKKEMNLRFDEVNRRFDEVDARFNRFEGGVASQFGEINNRLDQLNQTLFVGLFGVIAAVVANGIWG
jgi:archaellum component FlaC